MDRIKRLSMEVLKNYKDKFGINFAENKKILDQLSIIRSKGLKNEIAGYITKLIKKEIRQLEEKQKTVEVADESQTNSDIDTTEIVQVSNPV